MNQQAELNLVATGDQLRPGLEDCVNRLIKNCVLKKGDAFYCAEFTRGHLNVWSGKGKQPEWIREHLRKGGALDQLKTIA